MSFTACKASLVTIEKEYKENMNAQLGAESATTQCGLCGESLTSAELGVHDACADYESAIASM